VADRKMMEGAKIEGGESSEAWIGAGDLMEMQKRLQAVWDRREASWAKLGGPRVELESIKSKESKGNI
jgi:hypothetical protein